MEDENNLTHERIWIKINQLQVLHDRLYDELENIKKVLILLERADKLLDKEA
jgi:hypothetical protein